MKGLHNAGQTCYFNAAVQCLAYCPNMTNYFLAGHAETDLNPRLKGASSVAGAYAEFVRDYWTKDVTTEPADSAQLYAAFVKACRGFAPFQQHDAHEALVCLLDKLHEGLSRMKPNEHAVAHRPEVCRKPWLEGMKGCASVVTEVFRGQVEAQVHAPGYASVSHDHFTCLSLAVHEASSLAQCFQRHMAPETLTDFKVDDAPIAATLTKRFTYLPRILIVHLKRFDACDKIDRFIDYPAELDLGAYTVAGCQHHYQLFGVCLHRGSVSDGHYTTCGEVKGRWHFMDDEASSHMKNINDIIQKDAYVLLYKRL